MNKLIAGLLIFLLAGSVYLANEGISTAPTSGFSISSDTSLLFLAAVLTGLMSVMYFGKEVYVRLKAGGA